MYCWIFNITPTDWHFIKSCSVGRHCTFILILSIVLTRTTKLLSMSCTDQLSHRGGHTQQKPRTPDQFVRWQFQLIYFNKVTVLNNTDSSERKGSITLCNSSMNSKKETIEAQMAGHMETYFSNNYIISLLCIIRQQPFGKAELQHNCQRFVTSGTSILFRRLNSILFFTPNTSNKAISSMALYFEVRAKTTSLALLFEAHLSWSTVSNERSPSPGWVDVSHRKSLSDIQGFFNVHKSVTKVMWLKVFFFFTQNMIFSYTLPSIFA